MSNERARGALSDSRGYTCVAGTALVSRSSLMRVGAAITRTRMVESAFILIYARLSRIGIFRFSL